tara:strand:+ start:219 stop:539 length:321 start_codon:yes stop_codon:yes gene_type:complete
MTNKSLLEFFNYLVINLRLRYIIFFIAISISLVYVASQMDSVQRATSVIKAVEDLETHITIENLENHVGGIAPYYEGHDNQIEPNPHNKLPKKLELQIKKIAPILS